MKEILDTRFLLEYFYSSKTDTREKTRKRLRVLIAKGDGVLPTIVLAEITQFTCETRGKDMAESRYQVLLQSGLQIQELTANIAKEAGLLRSVHKNISMGDCIIAATAIENHARILSDDPHFDEIEETKRIWI